MAVLELVLSARRAQQGAAQFNTAVNSVVSSANKADRAVGSLDRQVIQVGESFTAGVRRVASWTAAIYASSRVLQSMISQIAHFEDVMKTIQAVLTPTANDMRRMTNEAQRLSTITRFSSIEAGRAMLELGRAGYKTNDVLAATKDVLNLAMVAEMDLSKATLICVQMMTTFGKTAQELGHITDVLTNSANETAAEVEELAESLRFAGPFAARLGIDIETTTAAIAMMSNASIKGAMAGVGFRGVLASLISPSRMAEKALNVIGKAAGYTAKDFSVAEHDLITVLKRLREAGIEAASAEMIFTQRAMGPALVLVGLVDQIEALTKANRETDGIARRVAQTMEDDLIAAWGRFHKAVYQVYQVIGEAGLLPAMRKVVDFMADVARGFSGTSVIIKEHEQAVQKIVSATKVAGIVLGSFTAALIAVYGPMIAAKTAAWALGIAIASITSPISATILAIMAIIAAITYFKDSQIEVEGVTASVWDYITAGYQVLDENLTKIWRHITDLVLGELDKQSDAAKQHSDELSKNGFFGNILRGAGAGLDIIGTGTLEAINGAAEGLDQAWRVGQNVFSAMQGDKTVGPTAADIFAPFQEGFQDVDRDFGTTCDQIINKWFDTSRTLGDLLGENIASAIPESVVEKVKLKPYPVAGIASETEKLGERAATTQPTGLLEKVLPEEMQRAIRQAGVSLNELESKLDDTSKKYLQMAAAAIDSGEGTGTMGQAMIEATAAVDTAIAKLEDERRVMNLVGQERQKAIDALEFERNVRESIYGKTEFDKGGAQAQKMIDDYKKMQAEVIAAQEAAQAAEQQQTKRKDVMRNYTQSVEMLQLQSQMIWESNEAYEKQIELLRMKQELIEAGITGSEQEKMLEEYSKVLDQAQFADRMREAVQGVRSDLENAFSSAMSNSIRDALMGRDVDMGEVFKSLGADIAMAVMDNVIIKPLSELLSNMLTGVLQGLLGGLTSGLTQGATAGVAQGATAGTMQGAAAAGIQMMAATLQMTAATIMNVASTIFSVGATIITTAGSILLTAGAAFLSGTVTFMASIAMFVAEAVTAMIGAIATFVAAVATFAATSLFGSGGTVSSPTRSIVGEAGPEAIFHFARGGAIDARIVGGPRAGMLGVGGTDVVLPLKHFLVGGFLFKRTKDWFNQGGFEKITDALASWTAPPETKDQDLNSIYGLFAGPHSTYETPTNALFDYRLTNPWGGQEFGKRDWLFNLISNFMDVGGQTMQRLIGQPSAALLAGGSGGGGFWKGGKGSLAYVILKSFLGPWADYYMNRWGSAAKPYMVDTSGFGPSGMWRSMKPFADGGIFSSPTLFGFGGGQIGVAGEAGPEAILPLKRGRGGKLGVAAEMARQINVHMNVQTKDAQSFRRSRRQIAADMKRSLRGV